jgi:hypothetical protein
MAGGAAIAHPRAEADQEAGDGDGDHAGRHLRHRHRVADEHGRERRRDQAGDESRAPDAVGADRIDQTPGNAGDAGDAAVEQHQEDGGKPDQRAADGGGDRSEIGHDVPRGGC